MKALQYLGVWAAYFIGATISAYLLSDTPGLTTRNVIFGAYIGLIGLGFYIIQRRKKPGKPDNVRP